MSAMSNIDIVILSIIGLSLMVGLYRGFVKEILSISMLLLSLVAAFYIGKYVVSLLPDSATVSDLNVFGVTFATADIIFFLTFTTVLVLGVVLNIFLSAVITKIISASSLNILNRLLGGTFGLLRGSLFVLFAVLLAHATTLPSASWWKQSQVLPAFAGGAEYLSAFFPNEYAGYFHFGQTDKAQDNEKVTL